MFFILALTLIRFGLKDCFMMNILDPMKELDLPGLCLFVKCSTLVPYFLSRHPSLWRPRLRPSPLEICDGPKDISQSKSARGWKKFFNRIPKFEVFGWVVVVSILVVMLSLVTSAIHELPTYALECAPILLRVLLLPYQRCIQKPLPLPIVKLMHLVRRILPCNHCRP